MTLGSDQPDTVGRAVGPRVTDPDGPPDPGGRGEVPRSVTGRIPQWVVDERLGVESRHEYAWRVADPPAATGVALLPGRPGGPRHGRGERLVRRVLGLVVAVGMVVALVLLVDLRDDQGTPVAVPSVAPTAAPLDVTTPPVITLDTTATPVPVASPDPGAVAPQQEAPAEPVPSPTAWTNPTFPPPGVDAAASPLGAPSPPPGGNGAFGFTAFQSDGVTPISYDPCRPLRWVLRPDNAPPDGQALLDEAFSVLQRTTGLQPRFDGTTTETPELGRSPYQPDRYGQAWAPVLVAWVTPEEMPELEGDVLGLAGSVSARAGDLPSVYVSGTVFLDGPQLAELYERPGGRDLVRSTIEHELGHLVGLGHVDDPTQLMYPQATGQILTFQSGDLEGLARLGAGACVPQI